MDRTKKQVSVNRLKAALWLRDALDMVETMGMLEVNETSELINKIVIYDGTEDWRKYVTRSNRLRIIKLVMDGVGPDDPAAEGLLTREKRILNEADVLGFKEYLNLKKNAVFQRSRTVNEQLQNILKKMYKYNPESNWVRRELRNLTYQRLGRYTEATRMPGNEYVAYNVENKLTHGLKQYIGISHHAYGHQGHNMDLILRGVHNIKSSSIVLKSYKCYTANRALDELNQAVAVKQGLKVDCRETPRAKDIYDILNRRYMNDANMVIGKDLHWVPSAISCLNKEQSLHEDNTFSSAFDILAKDYNIPDELKKNALGDYATLYYRSNGYKGEIDSFPYNMHRNTSSVHIKGIIETLLELGVKVILLGDGSQDKIEITDSNFYDYAHSRYKSDLLDLYLVRHAKYCLSGFGGGFYVPYLFNKYLLLIDWPMTYKPIWSKRTRCKMRNMRYSDGSHIELRRYFESGMHFVEDGLELVLSRIEVAPEAYIDENFKWVKNFVDSCEDEDGFVKKSVAEMHWATKFGYNYPVAVLQG